MNSEFLSFTTNTGWEDSSRCFFSAAERLCTSKLAEQVEVSPPAAVTLQVYWPLSAVVQLESSRLNRLSFCVTCIQEIRKRSTVTYALQKEANRASEFRMGSSLGLSPMFKIYLYLKPVGQLVVELCVVLQPCGSDACSTACHSLKHHLLTSCGEEV